MTEIPFDIVGFDLDGTLLDTHADLGNAVNHALGMIGRPAIPVGEVRDLIGGGAKQMLTKALAVTGGGVPDEELSQLHRELIRFYEQNIAVHTCLFDGGEAMLDGLAARGVRVAVVTNKLESLAIKVLDALRLSDRFFTIIGGDTLGPGKAKPAPYLLHEMLERAGGSQRAAYVGDTTFDTGAARAAGLPCVAVGFGFCDLPVHELGADAVIGHFDELIPTLARLQVPG
ncbi:MAG: HAD-IA family hydrolase [Novosphingobium sp.]